MIIQKLSIFEGFGGDNWEYKESPIKGIGMKVHTGISIIIGIPLHPGISLCIMFWFNTNSTTYDTR